MFNFLPTICKIDSKIGRQSNLFKQKLMSTKPFPEVASVSPKPEQGINAIINIQESDIEDSLEPHIQHFIKNIHKAYQESMVNFQPINLLIFALNIKDFLF